MIAVFSSVIAGVPTLEGSSESSSITKAPSNSEGSGPLLGPSSLDLGLLGFIAGDSVRDVDLRTVDGDLEIGDVVDFCRACSSAILESIAPFIRFRTDQSVFSTHKAESGGKLVPGTLCPRQLEKNNIIWDSTPIQ